MLKKLLDVILLESFFHLELRFKMRHFHRAKSVLRLLPPIHLKMMECIQTHLATLPLIILILLVAFITVAIIEVLEKNKTDTTDRVPTLEQKHSQDDITNNNSFNFNSGVDHVCKTNEDKEMDAFLVDVNKKSIEIVNNIEVPDGLGSRIIDGSNSSTSSDLSCEMVVITDISYTAPLDQDQDHDQKDIAPSKPEEEIANIPPSVCPEIDRNVETERSEKENSSGSLPGHILPTKNGGNVQASSSIVTEFVQDLLEELLSSDDPLQTIKSSSPKTIVPGSISIKKLANSFYQANVARNKTIVAKRSEITLWCLFSDKVVELRSNDKKLTDLTARKRIYNEMKPYFTDISIGYLQIKATTSAHDSNSDDSDANESDSNANKFDSDVYFKSDDSDANKSDSDVYFKSDDSDSDDEYDHEFHERLTQDDFDKMLSEAIEEELAYFDDPAPQSVTVTA
ncbi:hypothetical protein RhiirC2_845216 [Rhizophagus irregularis]|uniref:Uncharacterized protein n=1 Tax=Rhizophagus irregularis TaxID=588596 RepID=A0A2N1NRB1_9GLOM|nr:hypothetical protein RhiirC2_845216 [Rhizophagus irregularis]